MNFFQVVVFALLYQASSQGNIRERIFYGDEVSIKAVPYQAFSYSVACGASIISEQHLLTAAHCLRGKKETKVYVGSAIKGKGICFEPKSWVIHPKYKFPNNDIAIITLKSKIQFSDTIQAIALPSRSDQNLDLNNKTALISGWGYTESFSFPKKLRAANITITKCQNQKADSTVICIMRGQDKKTSCLGDSGGPLMIDNKLFGVDSFVDRAKGNDCTTTKAFAYTDVVKYLDWIEENTNIKIQA